MRKHFLLVNKALMIVLIDGYNVAVDSVLFNNGKTDGMPYDGMSLMRGHVVR